MSSSPAKQMIEVIKAIGQQLHVHITLIYKLLHVHHCLLPISRKEVHFLSRAAASSQTLLIEYPISLLSLQPFPAIWFFFPSDRNVLKLLSFSERKEK